ncbi:cytochrome c oxidase subunit 3 [Haloferacaceae archaeon DSL9]
MSTETDDGHDDHHHHLPAVEDWPRGFGEASWWPFVTAVGGAGIYIGVAVWLLADFVGPMAGPAVIVGSVGLFLLGIYGWLYHAFITKFWTRDRTDHGPASLRWGMIAFLGSELATFGAVFTYYFYFRSGAGWTLPEATPELVNSLILANTAILIASSFTLHWAHVAIREDNRKNFVRGLGLTLFLGIVFLGGQVLEYFMFIGEYGFTWTEGIYGSAFFGLTGLHGLHVALGAVILGIVFIRALYGQYSAERHLSVSTASMYWHFVDVVWVFLVVVLYLGSGQGISF